jgi:hypothetical protein
VPAACYEALKLELKENANPSLRKPELIQKLDRLCEEAAMKLRLSADAGTFVSENCRKSIRQARAIEAYRAEWPEN